MRNLFLSLVITQINPNENGQHFQLGTSYTVWKELLQLHVKSKKWFGTDRNKKTPTYPYMIQIINRY